MTELASELLGSLVNGQHRLRRLPKGYVSYMKATAIEFHAPRRVKVVDVALPELGPADVVFASVCAGLSSGTQALAVAGRVDPDLPLDESIGSLSGTFTFPFRYGYSCVGVVESGGPGLDPGQLVFCLHPHQSVVVRPAGEMVVVDAIDPRVATWLPFVATELQISLDADGPDEPSVGSALPAIGRHT